MASLTMDRLRGDVESFQSELMEEFYRNNAGLKDDMDTVAIYDKFAHLFSHDAIQLVKSATESKDAGDDLRWARYLLTFSTMGYVESAVKQLTDKANTFEAHSTVDFGGERIPYRMVPVKLRNEADPGRRRSLFEQKLVETEKLNNILFERMTSLHELSTSLGFKSYWNLCTALKGIDYKALETELETFTRRTESLYVECMGDALEKRAGMSLSDAWSCDISYAFRGEDFDKYFEKEKLVDAFFRTLKGMGLEPERSTNIEVDLEDRPKKTPRAFCAPIKVPDQVKLVIRPTGGWRDYDAFFHEGGHAWHFGNAKRDLPAEYRYLGDNSVTESFAFLFNYLPSNPLWLKEFLGMDDSKEFVRFTLTNKLMFLRRYGAKLVYELKLHNARVTPEFSEVYRSCLQKALKFRHTEKHFLEDVDDAFYCAEYLRAWILEGQMRSALVQEFGEAWFQNKKAGDYLRELWSYGQKYTADELVKTVGYAELDVEPLVNEIERGLAETG